MDISNGTTLGKRANLIYTASRNTVWKAYMQTSEEVEC